MCPASAVAQFEYDALDDAAQSSTDRAIATAHAFVTNGQASRAIRIAQKLADGGNRDARAYRLLFFTDGRLAERIETLVREYADDPLVGKIVAFVRAGGKRPLMRPRSRGEAAEGDAEG